MIIDTIKNSSRYPFYKGTIEKGLEFLCTAKFNNYSDGKHLIDGDRMFLIVSTYTTENDKLFEAHRKYIDIQYLISGEENIYWSPLENLSQKGNYSEKDDISFFRGENMTTLRMQKDYFCIFFPEDAHKPGCFTDKPGEVRKAVVKILF